MKQYIDKDIIKAEIEKRHSKNVRNKLNLAAALEDHYLLSFLDTIKVKEEVFDTNDIKDAFKAGYDMGVLQTTKKINSNIKEVDLEEEMNKWRQKHFEGIDYILDGSGEWLERTSQLDIAKHFFELGLKS